MALEDTKRLVAMGMEASRTFPPLVTTNGRITDENLWIAIQGFTGAFYAIWESLFGNQTDNVLRGVLDEMYVDLFAEYHAMAGGLRIALSHKSYTTTTIDRTEWEEDWLNDTITPVYSHTLATLRSPYGERQITFHEWARIVMNFWDNKLLHIERVYNQRNKAGWTPPPKPNKKQKQERERLAKTALSKLLAGRN